MKLMNKSEIGIGNYNCYNHSIGIWWLTETWLNNVAFLRFRVLELEKKKETVNLKAKENDKVDRSDLPTKPSSKERNKSNESDSSDDEVDDIDEYLDWRSKKAYK